MINGDLSPEEMLKLPDEKSGNERQMAFAEGYFYLGRHYLALGDKDKARDYFEKTRQQEVTVDLEHTAAGLELRRLKEAQ